MKTKTLIKFVLTLTSIILILFIIKYLHLIFLIKKILTILTPLFIGFFYAWFINPIIQKKSAKMPRNIVSIVTFFSIILILAFILLFTIPTIYKELSEVLKILPILFTNIENKINNMGLNNYLDKILSFLLEEFPSYLLNTITNFFRYLGVIGLGLILGLYISFDYPSIIQKMIHLIPAKYKCFTTNIIREISDEVRKCIHGTLLIAFFVFIADSFLFYLIKLDAPLIFGLICGITDLIPYVGPYIGGIIAIAVGFTNSKTVGLLTLIISIVIQSIENYLLQPLIMSKNIKLSPILIIVGLLLFGNLFGLLGMIISTPCVAIIKIFIENIKPILKKCK